MKNIFEIIKKDWRGNEPLQSACARIYEYLLGVQDHQEFYTFNDFKEMVGQSDADLAEAVMYLATPRLKVLKLCPMYEDRDLILELPREEVIHYSNGDPVIHPRSGEEMAEEEILVCFLPGISLNKYKADE